MKEIQIIPSKSDAHRALICAALSDRDCRVICEETSKDIEATKRCLAAIREALMQRRARDGETPAAAHLYCGESGSTFRFLIPVVAALGITGVFHPEGRLPQRPLTPLYEELTAHGVRMSPQGDVPFLVEGQLTPGEFHIPGNVSSQFISGLAFALPLLEGDSRIVVEGNLESAGYVDMTRNVIRRFGVSIHSAGNDLIVKGGQKYRGPARYRVKGDWSNAAFWLVMGLLGEEPVRVTGLNADSAQGDRAVVRILKKFGGRITEDLETEGSVTAWPSRDTLHGITVDAGPIPDMVPALALVGAVSEGTTEIMNAARLRIKESDRLATTCELLSGLGADVTELPDGLRIRGRRGLTGGSCDGCNDHRIVMTAAAASLAASGKVGISGWQAVRKSYPTFFRVMKENDLDGNILLL